VKKIIVTPLVLLSFIVSPFGIASEHGTKEGAVAMVKKQLST
jgi:hypothetical protein